jgi:hypothetical protein
MPAMPTLIVSGVAFWPVRFSKRGKANGAARRLLEQQPEQRPVREPQQEPPEQPEQQRGFSLRQDVGVLMMPEPGLLRKAWVCVVKVQALLLRRHCRTKIEPSSAGLVAAAKVRSKNHYLWL